MDRQKQILAVFDNDKELILKKSEIIKLGKITYYHSTEKHAGATLSRMVNNGLLIRVKQGYFKLGSRIKTKRAGDIVEDKNQTKLFE